MDLSNNSSFTPYFGVGAGLTNIKFFGISQIKPAIQGKLGLNYNISDKIQLSAGYRYFTALGDKFEGIKLDSEKEIPILRYEIEVENHYSDKAYYYLDVVKNVDLPSATTATVKSKFASHALEVGLIFNF